MKTVVVLVLLVLITVVKCQTPCSHTNPCKFVGGQPLKQPSQHVSQYGQLEMEYRVRIVEFKIEWLTLHRRTYDGEIPGATWRIKQGDHVHLHLINTLTTPNKQQPPNGIRFPNSTNIHTHGLHISSEEPQDNVFVKIDPGHSYHYFYEIDPQNPAGTYWYHSHLHGSSLFQVQGGMAGMIIVEDEYFQTPAHLWAVSCPDNCQHDIQLVFQPLLEYINFFGNGYANIQKLIQDDPLFRHQTNITSGGTLEDWLARNINLYTTNGQVRPVLTMATGQIKRFRMVNAGGTAHLAPMIYKETAQVTDGCNVLEIANDGVYLDNAAFPKSGRSLIVPSGKVDWLVVCNKPGIYEVRSLFFRSDTLSMGGAQQYNQTLFKIKVVGTPKFVQLQTSLPKRPYFVGDFTKLPQSDMHGRFVVEAAQGFHLNREKYSNHTHYRYNSRLEEMQEWYFVNTDPVLSHPIHMHINHFQVISYNKYTGPYSAGSFTTNDLIFFNKEGQKCYYQHANYTGKESVRQPTNPLTYLGHDERYRQNNGLDLGYSKIGLFRDTLLIPPLANITVRFLPHLYTGEVVLHCHLLRHEDHGMMMVTYIDHAGSTVNAVTPSGNAYPGMCNQTDVFPYNKCTNCQSNLPFQIYDDPIDTIEEQLDEFLDREYLNSVLYH